MHPELDSVSLQVCLVQLAAIARLGPRSRFLAQAAGACMLLNVCLERSTFAKNFRFVAAEILSFASPHLLSFLRTLAVSVRQTAPLQRSAPLGITALPIRANRLPVLLASFAGECPFRCFRDFGFDVLVSCSHLQVCFRGASACTKRCGCASSRVFVSFCCFTAYKVNRSACPQCSLEGLAQPLRCPAGFVCPLPSMMAGELCPTG